MKKRMGGMEGRHARASEGGTAGMKGGMAEGVQGEVEG